ncbi:HK97 family phage prohead protease [Pseudonocardia sichuanensis]
MTLYRTFLPELEIRAASKGGDGRTVEGIAVPYGRPQRIYDGLVEQFARGAFATQLSKPWRVRFTREHAMLGGALIGKAIELRDDAAGLWGAFRVSATPAGDETLTLIQDGVLDELSIGFREGRNRTLPDGTVERTRAHLTEVAVVLAGAYGQKAKVLATRAEHADSDEADEVDEQDDHEGEQPNEGGEVARSDASLPVERVNAARAAQLLARLPLLPLP